MSAVTVAEPSLLLPPGHLHEGSILLLESGPAALHIHEMLSDRGYRVLRAAKAADAASMARQRAEVVLIIVDQRNSRADALWSAKQLQPLKREFPWIELLVIAAPDWPAQDEIDGMVSGDDPALAAAISDAFNLARMQQFQAAERHNLEISLREFKSRTDAAVQELMTRARRRHAPVPALVPAEPANAAALTGSDMARLVKEERERARIRDQLFRPLALGHTGWGLVLALAEAHASGNDLTIKSAAYAAGLPLSSALRKINELCAGKYITRRQDPTDSRRSFISLTDQTRAALQQYFATIETARKG